MADTTSHRALIAAERQEPADLLDGLREDQWNEPSLRRLAGA
ncbi:hypothetical protein [Streptomyces virginiae]|nr:MULTISPECIES: hypothetical protein [Streptomyces]